MTLYVLYHMMGASLHGHAFYKVPVYSAKIHHLWSPLPFFINAIDPHFLLHAAKTYMKFAEILTPHYDDVRMGAIASQITSLTIVYSIVYSDADQRKHQSSASLAFVRGIHRGPVNFPHKWPVTRKMFPFDDVIMLQQSLLWHVWRCD